MIRRSLLISTVASERAAHCGFPISRAAARCSRAHIFAIRCFHSTPSPLNSSASSQSSFYMSGSADTVNKTTRDFGGDAERELRSDEEKRLKRQGQKSAENTEGLGGGGERLYTIIREKDSVVDVRAWLGKRRNADSCELQSAKKENGTTAPTSASPLEYSPPSIEETQSAFSVSMERTAREQLALLSKLSRQRVERDNKQHQQQQQVNGSGHSNIADTSQYAPMPRWMQAPGAMPSYASFLRGAGGVARLGTESSSSSSSSASQSSSSSSSSPIDIIPLPIAIMPDVHYGNGTTVGTVIPTYKALIPSSVGVDIGCGMLALKTSLRMADLCGAEGGEGGGGKDRILANLRMAIEIAVPHGRTHSGAEGNDAGGWRASVPADVADIWKAQLEKRFQRIVAKYPAIGVSNNINHLGTLGTGNHFIEVCVEVDADDEASPSSSSSSSSSVHAKAEVKTRRELQRLHPHVFGRSSSTSSSAEEDEQKQKLFEHHLSEASATAARGGHIWIMLHSGSRGVGGKIGSVFIDIAKKEMGKYYGNLPHGDLAYLTETDVSELEKGGDGGGGGNPTQNNPQSSSSSSSSPSSYFEDYCEALQWAQDYAKWNRILMANNVIKAMRSVKGIPRDFTTEVSAINCHHNYVEKIDAQTCAPVPWKYSASLNTTTTATVSDPSSLSSSDLNELAMSALNTTRTPANTSTTAAPSSSSSLTSSSQHIYLTRKGATSAQKGQLAIIPGSMGARSYIVQGKGNTESYCSCSHGAGRQYSRGEAKRRFTVADHARFVQGVECRLDGEVVDETPAAYKPIDAVIEAQRDLVDVVCVLKQILCVKG